MGSWNAKRVLLTFFLCLSFASSSQAAAPGPHPVGAGAYPLSFTDASAWFAHQSNETSKVVTVLFYFQGRPGWLSGNTDFKWQINGTPATIDMTVGNVPIDVKYWQDSDEVEVLGKRYSRSTDNVYFISQIDSGKPTVSALGNHDLAFTPDDILLLPSYAEIPMSGLL